MIEVQHLTKRYGPVTAVDDVSFSVGSGEILGFLGPNGAGKTTTMRVITGYMPASDGSVTVAGHDVFAAPIEAKRRTGYLPETPPLYPDMTVRDYVTFVAKIKGVPSREVRGRVDEVMKRTHVADMAGRHCGKLSKGYKQRVGLAQALIHNPEVLVLDEPTAGLDPKQIIEARQLIKELGGSHTVVLSTHILPEVSQTCQRVVIINKGRVVAVDTPDEPHRPAARQRDDVPPGAGIRRRRGGGAGRRAGRDRGPEHRDRQRLRERGGRQRARPRRAPRAGRRRRQPRLGPARAAADAAEPRGHLPQPDHRRRRRSRRGAPGAAKRRWPMRNVITIARRELQAYFASPIAYVVIGFFALLFGYFFYTLLWYFERQSMQVAMGSGMTMNINQMLIGPVFMNVSVIVLFVMPMITMRTYAEEKRSGTIELLLTSPLTDLQIILGKFLGALTLYAVMLAVTFLHIGVLFWYGDPEWKPVATGYLGLLLMGACFISAGLLISSLTKNQIVAGMVTFAVFLMLWVINWIGQSLGPTGQSIVTHLSITDHLDDFARGIIDTKHLIYYVSFIAFGLFLTAKSVDSERWRG